MSGSPFPGMDPYFEDPDIWPSVHTILVVYTATALNHVLPPPYVAVAEEWLRVMPNRQRIRPDALVGNPPAPTSSRGRVALLERPTVTADEPYIVQVLESAQHRQRYVNIVRSHDKGEVLATIECLNHSNKRPGKDRNAYLRKQSAIRYSNTHLIEIDLLRAGTPTLAVPIERVDATVSDYLICLHRGGTGARYELWPANVRQRLPRILVPIEAGVPDVVLDVQAVFGRAYDDGAFIRTLDYRAEPVPPLAPDDAEWADSLLKAKGLR